MHGVECLGTCLKPSARVMPRALSRDPGRKQSAAETVLTSATTLASLDALARVREIALHDSCGVKAVVFYRIPGALVMQDHCTVVYTMLSSFCSSRTLTPTH